MWAANRLGFLFVRNDIGSSTPYAHRTEEPRDGVAGFFGSAYGAPPSFFPPSFPPTSFGGASLRLAR